MVDKKYLFIFGATISLILWLTLWLWQKLVIAVGQAFYLPPELPAVNNLFLLIMAGLLVVYVASYYVVERQIKFILLAAGLFVVGLLFIAPFLSADLYLYIIYPKMIFSGLNPFVLPLESMSGDALFDSHYLIQAWRPYTMAYGPVWLVLSVPFAFLTSASVWSAVLSLKIMAGLFFGLSGYFIYLISKKISPSQTTKKLFLYFCSPLILLEVIIHGHNDIVAIFFVLAALVSLVYKKPLWSLPLLTLSVLVKYSTIFLWPVFLVYTWRTQSKKTFFISSGLSILIATLLFVPWWSGLDTFSGLVTVSRLWLASHAAILPLLVDSLWPGWGGLIIAKIFFVIFYLIYLWRAPLQNITDLLNASIFVLLMPFVLFFTYSQPWYFILPLVLLIVNPKVNSMLVFGLTFLALLYNVLSLVEVTLLAGLWLGGEWLIKKYHYDFKYQR